MKNKLVVISMDAMIQEDLLEAQKHPHFSEILENGAIVKRLKSIYPTLTYPCHTTMITGCYPDKHGIVTNTVQQPGISQQPWQFYHNAVKCSDIHDVCKRAGYSTASVGWPVTGLHPHVDYLLDEAWPMGEFTKESFEQSYLETGTPLWLMESSVEKHLWQRISKKQPGSSLFLTNVSSEIIKQYSPDVITIHIGNVDSYRHNSGVFSSKVNEGIAESDRMLGQLIDAARVAGTYDRTNFVVTSDHGQMNVTRTTRVNALLVRNGFIQLDANGNVTDWKAWCFNCGMSAIVKVRDSHNIAYINQIYDFLKSLVTEGVWGFSSVKRVEETAQNDRLSGDFNFVLETDNYTEFIDSWSEPVISSYDLSEYGIAHGCHGYHPDKGPSPIFIGFGPAFKKGATLESAHLVDGAPTYAAIMGVELPDADGRVMGELLN